MGRKKFFIDIILNIVSTALPLLILQLLALPIVASFVGGKEYGLIISLISMATLISFPLGNVLNNVRLLKEEDYKNTNEIGDFNLILLGSSFLAAISIVIATFCIDPNPSLFSIISLMLIVVLSVYKEYLLVGFQLVLNYKYILINNLFLGLGYFIGVITFIFTESWQTIYLCGIISSLLFIHSKIDLYEEPYRRTSHFKGTLSNSIFLYIAIFMKNIPNYADKLLILPILGPYSVAIYYSATIIGKIISMLFGPINSVMLSYLVKTKEIQISKFLKLLVVSILTAILGYIIILTISPYFFAILYPEWAEESLRIINITAATTVIITISSVVHPFNLRFNDTKWQIYMSSIYLVVYLVCTLTFANKFGLVGFSMGVLIASIFNLILQLLVLFLNSRLTIKEK